MKTNAKDLKSHDTFKFLEVLIILSGSHAFNISKENQPEYTRLYTSPEKFWEFVFILDFLSLFKREITLIFGINGVQNVFA